MTAPGTHCQISSQCISSKKLWERTCIILSISSAFWRARFHGMGDTP
jgi:hypothetical protein